MAETSGGFFRDSQGNDYEIILGYTTYTIGGRHYNWQEVIDRNGTVVWKAKESDDYWDSADAINNAKAGMKGLSHTGKIYAKESKEDNHSCRCIRKEAS